MLQRSCDLIINTTGINALSMLFYLLDESDELDLFKSVNLQGTISTNSWTESNVLYEAQILHFKYVKMSINIDAVGNKNLDGNKIMMISGSR